MVKKNELTPEELEAQRQEEEKAKARQEAEEARLKAEEEARTRAEEEAKAEAEANAGRPAAPAAPPVTQNKNGLLPLAELAQTHRVPTWQQAALHRLMGWEEGKQVTDAEYQAGLDRLSGRRMGGM